MIDPDKHIRAAAFVAIEKISRQWGGQVPWDAIRTGFQVGGERVLFANKVTGIFKPKLMSAALSIKTTVPRTGRSRWYRDQDLDSNLDHDTGLIRYDLAHGGQSDPTNRALLAAMQRDAPLIYFRGLAPTIYQPIFPVWVKGHKQEEGHVLLATADFEIPKIDSANTARDSIEASYSRRMTRIRNHQAWFSTRTKAAYQWRCAFSGLPVRELLVGAHIVPDAEGGPPWVQNGICMSALHHVAFDSHLIGVDPNFQVHVSPQLHDQEDGDLLVTLKDLDGKSLQLPREQEDWPDREFLEHRFVRFRNSSP
ncbi:MAG: HNH endonuclease [Gemmatimonadetes bacterium]|nr:HNH endonuclease [Gemmatimonadota bacterium]MYF72059.1 HNH endonuclease [Gemmatimonadota bacterium]MYK51752.1 HNH endonuclease [Gemmatimonadota bacterium]